MTQNLNCGKLENFKLFFGKLIYSVIMTFTVNEQNSSIKRFLNRHLPFYVGFFDFGL